MTPTPKPTERLLGDSAFAGDTGEAAPEVAQALASYGRDPACYSEALAAVQGSRLVVPVVALLGEVEYDENGLAHDKTSEMATVLMQGNDGRLALLAFTSVESMHAWNQEARPVPVQAELAARSALQEDAAAIVVDIAGPVPFVIEGDDLVGVSRGWTLAELAGRSVWIRPGER